MTQIAVIHEWLSARTGSDKTFEQIARAFPSADLYALSHNPEASFDWGGRELTTTFLDKGPIRERRALVLPLMPLAWRMVPVPKKPYDLVVTSSHAFANLGRPTRTATRVMCYCHTPARYLWMPELDQRSKVEALLAPARSLLRRADLRGSARVTEFAANSTETAKRIKKFYDREATVIPPPVDVNFFTDAADEHNDRSHLPSGDFLLAYPRYTPTPRLDLAMKAAAKVNMPIVIAGHGPDEPQVRKLANSMDHEVHIIVEPSQAELKELYQRATLLVFPAFEDFGIVPVEAQACGTPVVALAAGGTLDTVVPGVTGELAGEQTVGSFADAIQRALDGIVADASTPQRCRGHAATFSEEVFRQRIHDWATANV
jgi:glycosyltransferase involved in cell wall biosynthesis